MSQINIGPVYQLADIVWYNTDRTRTFREQGPCRIHIHGTVKFSQVTPQTYNRKRGPAIIEPDGYIEYTALADGYIHRTDGPAVINEDGSKEYWVNGAPFLKEEFFLQFGVL